MKTLIQKIAKKATPAVVTGLALLTLNGCDQIAHERAVNESKLTRPSIPVRDEDYKHPTSFSSWGKAADYALLYGGSSATVQLGDMDGDGDLDIVVVSKDYGLRTYENKIPQQNTE